jgi:hypothetical protein
MPPDLDHRIQTKLYLNGMEKSKAARRALEQAAALGWNIERVILIRTPQGIVAQQQ